MHPSEELPASSLSMAGEVLEFEIMGEKRMETRVLQGKDKNVSWTEAGEGELSRMGARYCYTPRLLPHSPG